MATFSDLINEVYQALEGWGFNNGRAAFITTSNLLVGGTSFTVNSTESLSEGVCECEDELIFIQSVNDGTLTVTIAGDGRGWRGTTAAQHNVGKRVTMNPVMPRVVVKRAINDTIKGVYPILRAKTSTTITPVGYQLAYGLPADCEVILEMQYQATGPTKMWPKVSHYTVDHNADPTAFPTGKSITIIGPREIGMPVMVTYLKRPTVLVNDNDTFDTVTGLNDTAKSAIVAGTLWRLAAQQPLAWMRFDSTAQDAMDEANRLRDVTQVTAYLRAVYEQELREESSRQYQTQPPAIRWND